MELQMAANKAATGLRAGKVTSGTVVLAAHSITGKGVPLGSVILSVQDHSPRQSLRA